MAPATLMIGTSLNGGPNRGQSGRAREGLNYRLGKRAPTQTMLFVTLLTLGRGAKCVYCIAKRLLG